MKRHLWQGALLGLMALGLTACNTPQDRAVGGALIGGAAGAVIGGAATGDVGGALVGGAIGAAGAPWSERQLPRAASTITIAAVAIASVTDNGRAAVPGRAHASPSRLAKAPAPR